MTQFAVGDRVFVYREDDGVAYRPYTEVLDQTQFHATIGKIDSQRDTPYFVRFDTGGGLWVRQDQLDPLEQDFSGVEQLVLVALVIIAGVCLLTYFL